MPTARAAGALPPRPSARGSHRAPGRAEGEDIQVGGRQVASRLEVSRTGTWQRLSAASTLASAAAPKPFLPHLRPRQQLRRAAQQQRRVEAPGGGASLAGLDAARVQRAGGAVEPVAVVQACAQHMAAGRALLRACQRQARHRASGQGSRSRAEQTLRRFESGGWESNKVHHNRHRTLAWCTLSLPHCGTPLIVPSASRHCATPGSGARRPVESSGRSMRRVPQADGRGRHRSAGVWCGRSSAGCSVAGRAPGVRGSVDR